MLIRTKLVRPSVPPDLVKRPRLTSALDRSPGRRVTLISAPAGSGKTTLVSAWLEETGARHAWLSLDRFESNVRIFSQYLVAALESAVPGALEQTRALLSRPEAPWGLVETTLCSEVADLLDPLVVVLEDYHTLSEGRAQQLVERLVHTMAENLHVVILTRSDPPLPLHRWKAKGWATELRGNDLAFTAEEVRRFYADGQAVGPDDESIARLHQRTEGWAAGLRLIKLSGGGSPEDLDEGTSSAALPGASLVAGFLESEVLARQPPEFLELLAISTLVERFDAHLCTHVLEREGELGLEHARDLIQGIHERNLFVVALDEEGRWHRHHDMFREVARPYLLRALGRERYARYIDRAVDWLASRGSVEEALRLQVESGDLDGAAALLGRQLDEVLVEDVSRQKLIRWLDVFPTGAERGRLPLVLARLTICVQRFDLGGLAAGLTEADTILADPGEPLPDPVLPAMTFVIRGFHRYWKGDAQEAFHHASRGLSMLPREPGGWTWSAGIHVVGMSLTTLGDGAGADEFLADAEFADAEHGGRHAELILTGRATTALLQAKLAETESHLRRIVDTRTRAAIADNWYGSALYGLGAVAYERNRLDEADAHFAEVVPLGFSMSTRTHHAALVGRSLVALARGDSVVAEGHADEAEAYAVQMADRTLVRVSASLKVRLQSARGHMVTAAAPDIGEAAMTGPWIEFPVITYARALLNGHVDGADFASLQFVEAALASARKVHNERVTIALELIRSVLLDRIGRSEEARAALSEALARAEAHELTRTVLNTGPALLDFLSECHQERPDEGYQRKMRHALREEYAPETTPARRPKPRLTRREHEVLALLQRRLSNAEIAEELQVGRETVKTHLRSIYSKLGVGDRRAAVGKAEEIGLVT